MGSKGFHWTSKYGSVIASVYEAGTAYDQQLALDEYWKQIGGTVMLPGTNRAAERLLREQGAAYRPVEKNLKIGEGEEICIVSLWDVSCGQAASVKVPVAVLLPFIAATISLSILTLTKFLQQMMKYC
jgi:penicillin V acylase-like amidase (Ntn superfamily)